MLKVTLGIVALLLSILGNVKLGLCCNTATSTLANTKPLTHSNTATITRSKEGAKVSVLARVLRKYTDKTDAVQTARRYQAHTDDPLLWTAMTIVESKCNSAAISACGAQGKLQVMPFWKKMRGFEFYRGKYSHLDDDLNFKAAYKVYRRLLSKEKGNKWRAVQRYCGGGRCAKVYAAEVKRLYSSIKSATDHVRS